jgi:cephalosporin hydroxylase
MTLSEIGDKYGTQKNTHVTFGKTLLDIYEPYFLHYKYLGDRQTNILEIGVLDGASLHTWNEYFPMANIYGIDINPPEINSERIKVFKADQGDIKDLQNVYSQINEKLDIVIDDGSHVNEYTLLAFNFFWDKLYSGGLYIIEDTICTYDKISFDWPGMKHNVLSMNPVNNRKDIDNFLLNHIQKMDFDQSDIFFIHIYRNVIIIKKA